MNTLMEFYEKTNNPLNDDYVINKLVENYAKNGENELQFATSLTRKKRGQLLDKNESNAFYMDMFNRWKNYILNISTTGITMGFNQGYLDRDFLQLRNYLFSISDITRIERLNDVLKFMDTNLNSAMKKYAYTLNRENDGTITFSSKNLLSKNKLKNKHHILTINLDAKDIIKVSRLFVQKCDQKNLPFEFRIPNSYTNHDDDFQIYSDANHLLEYHRILQEILYENRDIRERASRPSALSGSTDAVIGYHSDEDINFNIYSVIQENYLFVLSHRPKFSIVRDGERDTLINRITDTIIENKLSDLQSSSNKELYNKYKLMQRYCSKKRVMKKLKKQIKATLSNSFKRNSFKFEPVRFRFKRFGKNRKKIVEFTQSDLINGVNALFPEVVQGYPAIKEYLKQEISDNKQFDSKKICFKSNFKKVAKKIEERKIERQKQQQEEIQKRRESKKNATAEAKTEIEKKVDKSIEEMYQAIDGPVFNSTLLLGQNDNAYSYSYSRKNIIQDYLSPDSESSSMSDEAIRESQNKIRVKKR